MLLEVIKMPEIIHPAEAHDNFLYKLLDANLANNEYIILRLQDKAKACYCWKGGCYQKKFDMGKETGLI